YEHVKWRRHGEWRCRFVDRTQYGSARDSIRHKVDLVAQLLPREGPFVSTPRGESNRQATEASQVSGTGVPKCPMPAPTRKFNQAPAKRRREAKVLQELRLFFSAAE